MLLRLYLNIKSSAIVGFVFVLLCLDHGKGESSHSKGSFEVLSSTSTLSSVPCLRRFLTLHEARQRYDYSQRLFRPCSSDLRRQSTTTGVWRGVYNECIWSRFARHKNTYWTEIRHQVQIHRARLQGCRSRHVVTNGGRRAHMDASWGHHLTPENTQASHPAITKKPANNRSLKISTILYSMHLSPGGIFCSRYRPPGKLISLSTLHRL